MKKITLCQQFDTPVTKVFQLLSKHATLNTVFWPMQSVRITDSLDAGNPDGVGSIRKMGLRPIMPIREQITRVEANQLLEYRMLKNLFFSHHFGRMVFEEKDGKTLLTYTIELESWLPLLGSVGLLQLKLTGTRGLKQVARQLAA